MLALVCPGQGSQSPGFLGPWLEIPGTSEHLEELSAAADLDLRAHGTTSDADTIRDTAVAQPLIVAASLMTLRLVLDGRPVERAAQVVAGHSVGEFAAAAAAGVLTDAGAVGLVAHRARAMADAAAAGETGMSAVVGGDPDEVRAAIEAAGLTAANVNGAGQVVAAGDLAALAALAQNAPARARVIALQVAGAFHTHHMAPAAEAFAGHAAQAPAADPLLPLLSNADGAAYSDGPEGRGAGREVLDRLVAQIVAPVRWDLCQETLAAMGVTGVLELAPGGVRTGRARRSLPGIEAVALRTPADLDAAFDLVRRHGLGRTTTPTTEETA